LPLQSLETTLSYKMKKQLIGFLLLLSFVVSLSAQKAQTASALEANLRKHVEVLASDKFEGRRAGEPGAVLAGNYVAEQFRKVGLKPGFPGNGKPDFKQPFSYTPVRDPHSAPSCRPSRGAPRAAISPSSGRGQTNGWPTNAQLQPRASRLCSRGHLRASRRLSTRATGARFCASAGPISATPWPKALRSTSTLAHSRPGIQPPPWSPISPSICGRSTTGQPTSLRWPAVWRKASGAGSRHRPPSTGSSSSIGDVSDRTSRWGVDCSPLSNVIPAKAGIHDR